MRYQAKAEGFMAKLAKRPPIRHGFKIQWAIAAIAIVISTSLWLLASPPAEVEAQTPSGPAVSRSSPSARILDLRPGNTQQFTVSATAGDSIITGGKWFIDNVSQSGQSLALTQSTDRTTSSHFPQRAPTGWMLSLPTRMEGQARFLGRAAPTDVILEADA